MISPQFHPLVGGYERAAERLSVALAQRGHQVTIITERQKKEWPKSEDIDKVRIHRWWCVYKPGWHIITSFLGLTGFLLAKGRKFDVWHIHQYGLHAALVIAIGKVLRRPVLLKLTNTSSTGIEKVVENNRFPKISRWLHLRVSAIIALTSETAKEANSFGIPPKRIHILGNGIDINKFRPQSSKQQLLLKKKFGLENKQIVIFVGRLSEQKDVKLLLKSWAESIAKINQDWILVLIGFGPLQSELEKYANQLGINKRVKFVGMQKNVEEWLSGSDIFIQSSRREGLSNTMLEAMSSGLPVIVTQVSGTTEIVKETGAGIVVPIGDANSLANAIIKMISSDLLRQQKGAISRKVIEEKFSISKVALSHEKLYESLK